MLILTRKVNEVLVIGEGADQVRISVVGISGQQVRLGTQAPKHIAVHREEIYDKIQREKALNAEV